MIFWKKDKMTRRWRAPLLFALLAAILPRWAVAGDFFFTDQVLRTDTVWSGQVTIDGVVVVERGARLTIEPGTVVRFVKRDRNGDGIGDGELRVLGTVLAEGKGEAPIVFESAAASPAPMDWSFVMVFASNGKNIFRHCRFRHGFTGLQVHFSTARVEDCFFTNNNEGLRFGRANLEVLHNEFSGNDVGIRFTRMEGPVVIRANRVRNNRHGIFLVPSGQNITDFFEPDRSRPWNTGRLTLTGNIIAGNRRYNLKMGEKQLWDLEAGKNWWGSAASETIEAGLFDHGRDPDLGRVLYQPAATAPLSDVGPRRLGKNYGSEASSRSTPATSSRTSSSLGSR